MINVKIKGGKELHALMQQLPVEVETKILRQGMAKGANAVRDEARLNVAVESGGLRRSIKTSRNTKNGQVVAKVKLKGPHAFLGIFQEYGVAPHLISVEEGAKPTKRKRDGRVVPLSMGTINKMVDRGSLVIGGNFVGKMVQHPGHASRPFMRPALDTKAAEVVSVVGEYLSKYLQFGEITAPVVAVDEEE